MQRAPQTLGRRLWRYGPALAWIVVISVASTDVFSSDHTGAVILPAAHWLFPSLSQEALDNIHAGVRKAAHVTEFAIFGLLVARALLSSSRYWLWRHWFVLTLLIVAAMGLADEYHQSFVSSRTASIIDSAIDTSGGLVAITVLALWRWRHQPKIVWPGGIWH
jgi:VanZ family protein